MERLGVIGCDHRLLPPSRIAETFGRRDDLLARLCDAKGRGEIRGGLVLATCNRVEIVVDGPVVDGAADIASGLAWSRRLIDPALPRHEASGQRVVERLLRIATGLDSMVLGEEQILGQLTSALRIAEDAGLLSKTLHMLRTRILGAARQLRAELPAAGPAPSVASLGVEQLLAAGPRLGVVGAGQTARLALEILRRRKRSAAVVINRTKARASALASHFGAEAMSLAEFDAAPPALDGILCAVDSTRTLIEPRHVGSATVLVDLSRPAVHAPALREQAGVEVIDLDRLAELAEVRSEVQRAAAAALAARVEARARKICEDISPGRSALGDVVDLHVESARSELERAFRGRLEHLDDADRELVRDLLERTAKRHAHYHISDLKQLGAAT